MKLAGAHRKVYRNLADYGFSRCLTKGLRYMIASAYQNTNYRVYSLDVQHASMPLVDDERFSFRSLDGNDDAAIQQVEAMAEWLAGKLRARIANGSICMVALEGPRVVAFNLVSGDSVDIPPVQLRWMFRPGEVWSEHINTRKSHRNLGLGRKIRHRVIVELQRRGVEWLYGGTLRDHPATLRLAKRLGFEELGDLCYRRIGGRQSWAFQGLTNEYTGRSPSPFDGIDKLPVNQLSLQ